NPTRRQRDFRRHDGRRPAIRHGRRDQSRHLGPGKGLQPRVAAVGKWRHIWRIAGQYSNLSIFDVADNDELHAILWQLPLFAFMRIAVTPLATHPSAITEGANG